MVLCKRRFLESKLWRLEELTRPRVSSGPHLAFSLFLQCVRVSAAYSIVFAHFAVVVHVPVFFVIVIAAS